MASDRDISVIIVSYNCLEPLDECLRSIEAQKGVNVEVIVVDNNSHDDTLAFLQNQKSINAIFPGRNLGFGAAVNLAAKQAHGQYLFILNPDTFLPAGCLASLFEFANAHPGFGSISPLLLHPDGGVQISARKFPRRRDIFFGRGSPLFKLGLMKEKDAGYFSSLGEEPLQVPAVSATALLIGADLFQELGGFDERFFMYFEDLDLCKRIAEQSMPIWILPTVTINHAWRKSSGTRPYFASYCHHLSVYKYFKKYYPWQWFYNMGLVVALVIGYVFSSGLTALRRGDKR